VLSNSIIYLFGISEEQIIFCVEVIIATLFIQASESEWLEISEDEDDDDDDDADDNENDSEGDASQTDDDEEVCTSTVVLKVLILCFCGIPMRSRIKLYWTKSCCVSIGYELLSIIQVLDLPSYKTHFFSE
jgi:hypothetical protein